MNNVTSEKKDAITKTLAIIGFIAAILICVWLAVQVVRVIPAAFSSLASIADSVYNYKPNETLTVATQSSVVNSEEAFTISWTKMSQPGTYTFSYACTDGVAIDARLAGSSVVATDCHTPLVVGSNTSMDLIAHSEKQRFTDVTYVITFNPQITTEKSMTAQSKVTVVNASIPMSSMGVPPATTSITPATTTVTTATASIATPAQPAPSAKPITPTVAGKPTTISHVIYAIPTSNPNGNVDMQVQFLGVGTLNGQTFVPQAVIHVGQPAAIQFQVKNIGTKTADAWSLVAQLPGGISYPSGAQAPLRPNETAVITLGFQAYAQPGVAAFGAQVTATGDTNPANNTFTWAIQIVQ